MNAHTSTAGSSWNETHQQQPSLHPEATAEPELGDFRNSANVATTIELTDIYAMKIEEEDRHHQNVVAGTDDRVGGKTMLSGATVAIIPPEDVLPMAQQEKLGGACCGIFCDYRRAVIWSDVALVGLLSFFLVVQRGLEVQVDVIYYDDTVSNRVNEIYSEYLSKINSFGYITVLTSFASCISASLFSIWIPAFQIMWLISFLIACIIIFRNMYEELEVVYATTPQAEFTSAAPILMGIAICVTAFLYPHVAYVYEVHRGILTRETYSREERCCCS